MNWSSAQDLRAMVFFVTLLFLQLPAVAAEPTVPAGCDAPTHPSGSRKFYIDPVRGSMANDGSAERPWRTFAEVVALSSHLISSRVDLNDPQGTRGPQPVNPDGPVKPGDTLVLLSGDHGAVDLSQYQNENFIFVVAGENQTPVIRSLQVLSSTHWYFKGLKFQGARPEKDIYASMVRLVENKSYYGPGGNFVFVANSFSTQDDASGWSGDDWVNKPYGFTVFSATRCTTLAENHFYNVRNAAHIDGDDSLAIDNLVEFFGNDAIDVSASNLLIRHNTIRSGHHTPAEGSHPDGIQGWTYNGATNRNVVIDSNMVIDTNQSDDNAMQGISIFTGSWDGVNITNNVVVTNVWNGISLFGARNSTIINNTVLPSKPQKMMTRITVHRTDESPSSNIVVRNNITGDLIVDGGANIQVDHNIAWGAISIARSSKGGPVLGDVTASFNMDKVSPGSLFKEFDMSVPVFDLHLTPNSLAREAGSAEGAPAVDIEGRVRRAPMDIGAYAR